MDWSRTIRLWFVSTLVAAILLMMALTAWLVWPAVYESAVVRPLIEKLKVAAIEDDWTTFGDVYNRLGKIGSPAVPGLFELMKYPDDQVQFYVSMMLIDMLDDCDAAAIRSLIEALASDHEDVQVVACVVLKNQGADAKAAVPALTRALHGENLKVRIWPADALGHISPESRIESAGILRELLQDQRGWIRMWSFETLRGLDLLGDGEPVPLLIELAKDDDKRAASSALVELLRIDHEAAAKAGLWSPPENSMSESSESITQSEERAADVGR